MQYPLFYVATMLFVLISILHSMQGMYFTKLEYLLLFFYLFYEIVFYKNTS